MLSALFGYLRSEAAPRFRSVVVTSELGLAAATGIAFAIWGSCVPFGAIETGDAAVAVLSYAAIAFGFSIAGLTIALTTPGEAFARELAWSDPRRHGIASEAPRENSYANLLFIFSWTAFAHWVVIVAAFLALAFFGKSAPLLAADAGLAHRVGAGLLVAATVYAVALFLVTLITLANVGAVYIGHLHRKRPKD